MLARLLLPVIVVHNRGHCCPTSQPLSYQGRLHLLHLYKPPIMMSTLFFLLPCPISCLLHQCGRHMQPHFSMLTRSVLTFTSLAYCLQLQNPTSLASIINYSFHQSGLPNLRVHGSCQLLSLSHSHLHAPLYTSILPVPMVVCSLLYFTLQ